MLSRMTDQFKYRINMEATTGSVLREWLHRSTVICNIMTHVNISSDSYMALEIQPAMHSLFLSQTSYTVVSLLISSND